MGFTTVENLLYVGVIGLDALTSRLFYVTPANLMFAAMWGCAMGTVCFNKKNEIGTLLKGYCAAVILNATWDLIVYVDPKNARWWLIPMLVGMALLVYLWVRKLRYGCSLPKVRDDVLVHCNLCGTCVMEGEEVCSRCGESVAGTGEVS
jgi:RsiW-degrading membrane proteinase PrsW (M82 family)